MPPIVRSATVNTDKDDIFVRSGVPFQIFQYLVNHGLGLLLEDEVLSEVANNVLEQEEVVGVEPCILKGWMMSINLKFLITNVNEFVVFIFVNIGQKFFIREPGALWRV